MKYLIILFFCWIASNFSFAQDAIYSQNYAIPSMLNPALTGGNKSIRAVSRYRNQWPNVNFNFEQFNFAADYFAENISSGFGVVLSSDLQLNRRIATSQANLLYSYHHAVSGDITFMYGASLGFGKMQVDWDKVTFGDMIDLRHGVIYAPGDVPIEGGKRFIDIDLGFAAYTKNMYAGVALHHLNRPNTLVIVGENRLNHRYTGHGGFNIHLIKDEMDEGKFIISPNLVYLQQSGYNQFLIGSYFQFFDVTIGGWYRGGNSFFVVLGYHFKGFSFSYSYDYMSRNFDNAYLGGSHEVTFGYQLRNERLKTPFPMF